MSHLATPEFKKLFENYPFCSQVSSKNPKVIAKLFDSFGSATWYLTEYSALENTAFGYVTGLTYDEWGYISLNELENIRHSSGIPRIERDIYFSPCTISELIN
jgi:hypothetical protein